MDLTHMFSFSSALTPLALNVAIPTKAPTHAVVFADSLVSFSIEQDRWTDWVGSTERNEFLYNTLDNIVQLTGVPPQFRIGANSQDRTNYDPNIQFSDGIYPAPSANVPYPEASSNVVGDDYYKTAKFLPPNTHVIWGVNLGSNNLTSAYLEAKSIKKAFATPEIAEAGIVLDALQFGNEPDLYKNNGLRQTTYDATQYVEEWLAFATNVSEALELTPASLTKFWAADFAHSGSGFSPQAIFAEGLLESAVAPLISTYSQHHYSGSFCSGSGGLLQDLMTKETIRGNLSGLQPDIAAVRQQNLDYVLGETNSYACHGAPGVSNTAGAALWTLDYALYGYHQIGISRVYFHNGIGFKYNLIQPATLTRSPVDGKPLSTPLLPHVQPQYYAAIIIAEAIGHAADRTTSVELDIGHPQLSGYAFYDGDSSALKKVLLINSQGYFASSSGPRGSIDVILSFEAEEHAPRRASLKRLSIEFADDVSGLTWGGQTYETTDGRVAGELRTTEVDVTSGFSIQDTEVVLLDFVI